MLIAVVSLVAVGVFVGLFRALRVYPIAKDTSSVAVAATTSLRNPSLSDDEKEQVAQSSAIRMIKACGQLTWRLLLTLFSSTAVLLAADATGLATFESTVYFLLRWDVLAAITIGFLAWGFARR